jgi:hypothetical protein
LTVRAILSNSPAGTIQTYCLEHLATTAKLMVVQALTHVSTQWHRVFMGTPYELILALESISGASRRESMLSWRLMGLTPGVR